MRPLGIVEAPPLLDENFSLPESVEDLHVKTLVPELAVEAFIVAVLPAHLVLLQEFRLSQILTLGADHFFGPRSMLYKARNAIERMFGRLKDFRRIATRYDRKAQNFLAAICIAAVVSYWL